MTRNHEVHVRRWTSRYGDPELLLLFPFDAPFVERLKAEVRRHLPTWEPALKAWRIERSGEADLLRLLDAVFGPQLCPVCMAGETCSTIRDVVSVAARLGLGGPEAGDR